MITKDSYEGELKKFRKYCRKHPNELGCYVYALADPTKGKEQVFYVGKGQKERMFNHHRRGFCDVDTLCNNANVREKIHVLPEEKILVIKISGTESSDADILERVRKS